VVSEQQTLAAFIKRHRIKMSSEQADSNPNFPDSDNMDHWKCILIFPSGHGGVGRRMTLYFSKGYGHHGKAPKADEVLDCLALRFAAALPIGPLDGFCSLMLDAADALIEHCSDLYDPEDGLLREPEDDDDNDDEMLDSIAAHERSIDPEA